MSDEGKLFVGGLSFDTNEESLSNAFSKFGSIQKVDVIRDKDTGRSRGFGFVKFDNAEDAKDALEGMSGKSLDGREIRVDEAGKSGRKGGSQTGSRGGGSRFGRSWGARGSRGYQRDFEGGSGYYSGERGYRDRSYGDRNFGGGERSGGSGGNGGYRSGGYSNSYRDNRGQGGYDRASSYREGYDSYD